jgi:hypothetical protein
MEELPQELKTIIENTKSKYTREEFQALINRVQAEHASNPATPSAELQHYLDYKAKRDAMRAAGEVEPPSAMAQATQYARVEMTHATQGPASEADAAARLAICMACPDRAVEYKGMTDAGGVGWCTKCGCGNNPRAMLSVKVTLAGVECPLAKWGKVEGTGATVASAVDAVAGVAKSIIHKLSGG